MTQVKFSFKRPDSTGLVVAGGRLRFRPFRRYVSGESVVIPRAFEVALSDQGEATVELTPTSGVFAWMVTELLIPDDDASPAYTFVRYVEVPDSKTAVDYATLVDLDPATGAPVVIGDGIFVPKIAADMESAIKMSEQHPAWFVFYDASAEAASAAADVASIRQLGETARTEAARVTAVRASVEADGAQVGTLASDAATLIAARQATVTEHAQSATTRMDEAVSEVQAAAIARREELSAPVDTPTVIPEDGE